MDDVGPDVLLGHLDKVSKLEFPYIETKNDFRAITVERFVERHRADRTKWIVSDGVSYWCGEVPPCLTPTTTEVSSPSHGGRPLGFPSEKPC